MPRPIDRIPRILEKLSRFWHQHADWRLGQLIENVLEVDKPGPGHALPEPDLFYVEDEELERRLDVATGKEA